MTDPSSHTPHDDSFISRLVSVAPAKFGAVLLVMALLAMGLMGGFAYEETLASETEESVLEARLLDDHNMRSIEATSVTLTYLSQQFAAMDASGVSSAQANQLLTQPLAALAFVRSLSVVDERGVVVASSNAADIHAVVDMSKFGTPVVNSADWLGGYMAGRGLADMASSSGHNPSTAVGVGFIPLVRVIEMAGGRTHFLLALLNPDAISAFQIAVTSNANVNAYLLNYQGQLLASTNAEGPLPGSVLNRHPVFASYLPRTESGTYLGQGVLPGKQLVAFRLAKNRPLMVLVETSYQEVLNRWAASMRWVALAGLLVVALFGFMSWVVQRNVKQRQQADGDLALARANEVRREYELRVLVQSVQEIIFRTNPQGLITYVNKGWVSAQEEEFDDLLGKPVMVLADADDAPRVEALFLPGQGNAVRTTIAKILSLQGKARHFAIAVVPLHDAAGISGYAGSAVDVTDRMEAESALQRQLAFVALLLEVSPLPVATFDAQGRYTSVNRAWEEFMGRTRQEVAGQRGIYFMTPEDAAMHASRDAEMRKKGGDIKYEAKVTHKDGSRRDVVVSKVMLPDDGHGQGWLSTMMDVSEFRDAERATREAKEAAEESSRAKTEFTGNISHELRTPLQSILGFSELGVARSLAQPRLHTMFQEIHLSGERMLALVNDLLDISKIESSVGSVHFQWLDVRVLIHTVVREIQPLLDGKQLVLTSDVGAAPLMVKADPMRMAQVVRNVLANAIKFSPPGEGILVSTVASDEHQVYVQVRDRGVGIPAAELETIFEAFVQSSNTKDGSGGTGLGLAICRKILKLHAGSIEAMNMPDKGCAFNIRLPRYAPFTSDPSPCEWQPHSLEKSLT